MNEESMLLKKKKKVKRKKKKAKHVNLFLFNLGWAFYCFLGFSLREFMFVMRQGLKFLKKRNGTGWDWPSPNVSISSSLGPEKHFLGFCFPLSDNFLFFVFFVRLCI